MLSVSILSYPVTPHNNRISWPLAFVFFICYTRENAFAFSQKECLARPGGRLAFRVVTRNRYSFGLCVSLWYNRENSASFLNKNAVAAKQLPVLTHQRIFAVCACLYGIINRLCVWKGRKPIIVRHTYFSLFYLLFYLFSNLIIIKE